MFRSFFDQLVWIYEVCRAHQYLIGYLQSHSPGSAEDVWTGQQRSAGNQSAMCPPSIRHATAGHPVDRIPIMQGHVDILTDVQTLLAYTFTLLHHEKYIFDIIIFKLSHISDRNKRTASYLPK